MFFSKALLKRNSDCSLLHISAFNSLMGFLVEGPQYVLAVLCTSFPISPESGEAQTAQGNSDSAPQLLNCFKNALSRKQYRHTFLSHDILGGCVARDLY